MVHPLGKAQVHHADSEHDDFDHHTVLFSTRYADYVPTEVLALSPGYPAFGVLPTADGGKVVWALR